MVLNFLIASFIGLNIAWPISFLAAVAVADEDAHASGLGKFADYIADAKPESTFICQFWVAAYNCAHRLHRAIQTPINSQTIALQ